MFFFEAGVEVRVDLLFLDEIRRDLLASNQVLDVSPNLRRSGEEFSGRQSDLGVESSLNEIGGLDTGLDGRLIFILWFLRSWLRRHVDWLHRTLGALEDMGGIVPVLVVGGAISGLFTRVLRGIPGSCSSGVNVWLRGLLLRGGGLRVRLLGVLGLGESSLMIRRTSAPRNFNAVEALSLPLDCQSLSVEEGVDLSLHDLKLLVVGGILVSGVGGRGVERENTLVWGL